MNQTSYSRTCHRLFQVISAFFDHQEWTEVKTEALQDIFFENLSEVLQLSLDLSLSLDQLNAFTKESGTNPDMEKLAGFIIQTIEKDETYIILNFYLFKFIGTYLEIANPQHQNEIEELMNKAGLTEKELNTIPTQYQMFVQEKNKNAAI